MLVSQNGNYLQHVIVVYEVFGSAAALHYHSTCYTFIPCSWEIWGFFSMKEPLWESRRLDSDIDLITSEKKACFWPPKTPGLQLMQFSSSVTLHPVWEGAGCRLYLSAIPGPFLRSVFLIRDQRATTRKLKKKLGDFRLREDDTQQISPEKPVQLKSS